MSELFQIIQKVKKVTLKISILVILISCTKRRELTYAGIDDMFIGTESINLYKNGEFNIELEVGFHKGKYHITSDTIHLLYEGSKMHMPLKFVMTPDKFESVDFKRHIVIKRYK